MIAPPHAALSPTDPEPRSHGRPRGLLPLLLLATSLLLPFVPDVAVAQEVPAEQPTESAREVERWGDLVSILSGDIHVPANMRLRGSVICLGGDVVIEGHVTRDVVVILGSLEVTGTVGGQVTGVLSDLELRNAELERELVSVLGSLELENTTVGREMINVLGSLDRDQLSRVAGQFINIGFGSWAPSFWAMLFWTRLFHKFIVFVLVLLLVALVPERIRVMGEEAPVRYVPAFFVGLLGYLAMLVLVALLSITVVGIPLAAFGFYVIKWMGIAGIFYAVGRRIGRTTGHDLSILGAVLLVFAIYVLLFLAPTPLGLTGILLVAVLRIMFFLLIEAPAVGLAILTRLGGPSTGRAPATSPARPTTGTGPLPPGPEPPAPEPAAPSTPG